MTIAAVELGKPQHRSFRLTKPGQAVTSVATQVRPAIVLPDREARALLSAAERADVSNGGCFSAGPAGIQVWSGPWNGLLGRHGDARHLGSVDWSYDTPTRHYITVYRVLALAGVEAPKDALALPVPPPRDPFRSDLRAGGTF